MSILEQYGCSVRRRGEGANTMHRILTLSLTFNVQAKKNEYPQLEFFMHSELAEEEFKRADKNSK